MTHFHLNTSAGALPEAWKSTVLSRVGGANLKVMRMDGGAYPDETHDYPEGLLVIDGRLHLTIAGQLVVVGAGELYVVPPGQPHAVAPGSNGTLLIFDI